MSFDDYSIQEHTNRFALWSASRAASVKGCRFSVLQGRMILSRVGIDQFVLAPETLPGPEHFCQKHEVWRKAAIGESKKMGLLFTHGVAAKLINVYLKAVFVCGRHQNLELVKHIHPPIDAVLLKALKKSDAGGLKEFWKDVEKKKWSKWSSGDYQEVIDTIKKTVGDEPLWKIEKFWKGHQ